MDVRPKSAMTNYEELMLKLPAHLQPVMLSSVVKEKLTDGAIVTSGAVSALTTRLLSAQFVRGIIRIIRHVDSQKKQFDEGMAVDIENGLRNIELCAVESLKTSLFHKGQLISGSEEDVPFFQEKVMVSGREKLKVCLNSVPGLSDANSATSLIAQVIEEIYGELLGKKMVLIPEMLRCPVGDIWLLLDRRRIRRDDTYDGTEMGIYAEPGGFIPIEEHHLLNDAFLEFEPGEYVGYQLHDPSLQLEEGVATYIYAVITKEVEVIDEDAIILTKVYQINIGYDKEPIEVNAAVLYKFHRIQDISAREKETPRNRSREVIFREISEQLAGALRLKDEQRRQIVKRLILQWHPRKHLEDKEFYSEAFEHIKNELGGSYDKYIDAWVRSAIEHEAQREEYIEKVTNSDVSWPLCPIPLRLCIRNPQPEEAKRWFRQAEADLAAGANEIDSGEPFYEWACFKCHQAAEKALKAAQYTIDADKTSVHNLVENCDGLDDSELKSLASSLERLVGGSARMRYPDQVSFPKIPNEVYSAQMAEQALQLSQNIVMRVKDRIL